MNKKYLLPFYFLLLLLSSCDLREESIDICYYKPIVEFSVHQDCKSSYNKMSELATDCIIYI